ncbi:MAG: ABC transporter ATP-binding protein [Limnospira sp. PMC 1291.21]|uniref:ABC transporter related n=2 Tax=Limnospira TaxID=2596745 RepID=B5VUR1_LIMMA|nr:MULTISPECIES: ABC transporter ATP-binding protein [Limnospira]EKD10466.1 ABC transporter related protein [Arthrospira platensis C1]MDC0836420.1 ABC transporter ATP-binding protein [Limnoraphis robusta]MDY7052399.1 ABC transporter ATP-binding protein [Limnospira fusiformis LS22]QJB28274.1 ABC transporter ATP-binding protein [Limnospira fusiformis SAG 85.79]EDZ97014.1 ABC transporter related [Limnospira maxima CS-328]
MQNFINRFFFILPASPKQLVILVILFVVMSVLEAFGIGMIGPFLNLASHPNLVNESEFVASIYAGLNLTEASHGIALLGLFIIALFAIKSFLNWQIKTYVFGFCLKVRGKLCEKLIQEYLSVPYTFHLSKDSAAVIQCIIIYTQAFALDILMPILNSAANLMIIIALSGLLLMTSQLVVIVLIFLFLPLILILNAFKDKIKYWGKRVSYADESIIRIVNHSLGGIKETKVIGCSGFFEEQLSEQSREYIEAGTFLLSFQVVPRILVEAILILFLVGITSTMILLGQDIDGFIPALSIFALSSIRLLPAISNLSKDVSKLRSMTYVLERLSHDLREIETLKNSEVSNRTVVTKISQLADHKFKNKDFGQIIFDGVTYQYPGSESPAISDVSLSIRKGESIAFIGQSGAGKTTLVDIMLGLLIPQGGDIKIDDISIYNNLRSWQNMIGYIPQSIFLMADTIERNIAFGVADDLIDHKRLQQALEMAQLMDLVKELPDGINTMVGERGVRLSGGQRQRIGIARALYHERDILVLDEATSALDNETESLVTESIKSLSGIKTMIMIAHRLTTIQHCDRLYVMEKGRIVRSGTYNEIVLGNIQS